MPITPTPRRGNKFGTFGGVFTPSILTILSAILFMRANFVVGEAGIWHTLGIVALANLIALMSAFSVCAVSTNMQVRGGGAYFLISRVLGPEFGGALGLVFFFAMSLNVAFNVLGFTEALVSTYPALESHFLMISLSAAAVLFVIALFGAGVSIKTQYVIMAVLVLSIAVMWIGAALHFDPGKLGQMLRPEYTEILDAPGSGRKYGFWLVFAIFFPSVTGFLAGVNMSGDLKDPMKSIPRGTFLAIGVGAVVYLVTMFLGAGAFSRELLVTEPLRVLKDHAPFSLGILVPAGVFAATLSTALGSYLGAPRILQAVARDRLLPILRPFARGSKVGDEPRRALVLTGVLTFGVLLWASLVAGAAAFDTVAGIISMVFLATYGMLNLSAFTEAFGANPSFRPRFKPFHWSIALLGFIACLGTALLIDPIPAVVAALAIAALWYYLKHRELKVAFGDAWRGYAYQQLKRSLLKLQELEEDGKNWRPTVLAFSGSPTKREKLVSYAMWLEAGRGIVQLVYILRGDPHHDRDLHMRAEKQLVSFCRKSEIQAFPITAVAGDVATGIQLVLQTASIGPLKPNVALFGWNTGPSTTADYAMYLRNAETAGMGIVLVTGDELPENSTRRRIDVWWRGRKNGGLMLLMAYLLTRNWEWSRAQIRLLRVISDEEGREPARKALRELINTARVDASAEVIVSTDPFPELLHRYSGSADCVFLGFEVPDEEQLPEWHTRYNRLVDNMPTCVLVNARAEHDVLV